MNDELSRLKKLFIEVLEDYDAALNQIERISRRVRKRVKTEEYSPKKYRQKKRERK